MLRIGVGDGDVRRKAAATLSIITLNRIGRAEKLVTDRRRGNAMVA